MMGDHFVLPDVLVPNLRIVFCGTAVGNRSAEVKAYYADRGNKFWRILYETGLTPRVLNPQDYRELLQYGLGLSDLVKRRSGLDSQLTSEDYDVTGLKNKMMRYQPCVLCLNGKKAGNGSLPMPAGCIKSFIQRGGLRMKLSKKS